MYSAVAVTVTVTSEGLLHFSPDRVRESVCRPFKRNASVSTTLHPTQMVGGLLFQALEPWAGKPNVGLGPPCSSGGGDLHS